MKKILFLFLLILNSSCTKRELIVNIGSQELVNLGYKSLIKIDSITAYELLTENPEIGNWSQSLELLKEVMPKKYLEENLAYEKDKVLKDFLKNNDLYHYIVNVNDEVYRGIITRSISKPDEWMEKGHHVNLYFIEIKNRLEKPILVNSFIHDMGVTSWEKSSITEIYSDFSIQVKMKIYECSDFIIDGKTSCNSTSITSFYQVNPDTGEVQFSSDTVRY